MSDFVSFIQEPQVTPIFAALAIGLAAFVLSRWLPGVCKFLAVAAGVLVLFYGLSLWQGASVGGTERMAPRSWLTLTDSLSIRIELAATNLGMLVVLGAGLFTVLVGLYSFGHMAGKPDEGKYYAYMTWTLAGACIVGLAGNLVVLLVGWELTTLMLFLLINLGRKDGARGAAAKTYGMLGFGDACLVLAVGLLLASRGGQALSLAGPPRPLIGGLDTMVFALILVACLAKAGAIPLHTWIPSIAEEAPLPVVAYLPAALDKLLGIYLLGVLCLRMFLPGPAMREIMMILGAVTILAAVFMAMMQHRLKKLLSFHAVSQVGYMVLGIGTGTVIGIIGGLFHMLNNAIYKCCLFLMSGRVEEATGTDEIDRIGGLAKIMPVTFVCGAVAAAAISGVPPFNGFASKWLVYQGTLQVGQTNPALGAVLVAAAVFGSALTLASFIKVMYSGFLAPGPKGAAYLTKPHKEKLLSVGPMVVLAALCVILGLAPGLAVSRFFVPEMKADLVQTLLGDLHENLNTDRLPLEVVTKIGLWAPTKALALIIVGIVLGLAFSWVVAGRKVRVVRPFLAGEVPKPDDDRFRVPGTHFYQTIGEMPILGALLHHGERGAMDLYRWAARYGGGLVQVLRNQHTGLISLYVAWCLLGLAAALIYLLAGGRT